MGVSVGAATGDAAGAAGAALMGISVGAATGGAVGTTDGIITGGGAGAMFMALFVGVATGGKVEPVPMDVSVGVPTGGVSGVTAATNDAAWPNRVSESARSNIATVRLTSRHRPQVRHSIETPPLLLRPVRRLSYVCQFVRDTSPYGRILHHANIQHYGHHRNGRNG